MVQNHDWIARSCARCANRPQGIGTALRPAPIVSARCPGPPVAHRACSRLATARILSTWTRCDHFASTLSEIDTLQHASPETSEQPCQLRVHLTNVTARGPAQVAKSLLPALEATGQAVVTDIHLPDSGELAGYARISPGPPPSNYRRKLSRAVSRTLECTLLARQFDGDTPILVLGDIPLRCRSPQVVFVQTAHLCRQAASAASERQWTHVLARLLFRLNARWASVFVVQTDVMKELLERTYPGVRGRVAVIAQPAPSWLIESGLRREGRRSPVARKLDLLYPADAYPYKNHALLGSIRPAEGHDWPVARLRLTIPESANPNPQVPWINCAGSLSPSAMVQAYTEVDAVLYLSTEESYGLPLVEAMHLGLPVVAPDLPYARALCGQEAIYFAADRVESLRIAVAELSQRLARGWWPDWSDRLASVPSNWSTVARLFVQTARTAAEARPTVG